MKKILNLPIAIFLLSSSTSYGNHLKNKELTQYDERKAELEKDGITEEDLKNLEQAFLNVSREEEEKKTKKK